jgi:hypothetical protein
MSFVNDSYSVNSSISVTDHTAQIITVAKWDHDKRNLVVQPASQVAPREETIPNVIYLNRHDSYEFVVHVALKDNITTSGVY